MRRAKHFALIGFLCALSLTPFLGMAAAGYAPLAPLPGSNGQVTPEGAKVTPSEYVINLIKIAIGAASGLAVLAIAYSGIKWMMSDVVTNKSDAVQGIKNALLGLLLAISAYLILYTINPTLTKPVILETLDGGASPSAPSVVWWCTWSLTSCGSCANGVSECTITKTSPPDCTGGFYPSSNRRTCTGGPGASCTQDDQCESGLICVAGYACGDP